MDDFWAINRKICEALGINPSMTSKVTIYLTGNYPPKVVTEQIVGDLERAELVAIAAKQYHLVSASKFAKLVNSESRPKGGLKYTVTTAKPGDRLEWYSSDTLREAFEEFQARVQRYQHDETVFVILGDESVQQTLAEKSFGENYVKIYKRFYTALQTEREIDVAA